MTQRLTDLALTGQEVDLILGALAMVLDQTPGWADLAAIGELEERIMFERSRQARAAR